MTQTPFTHLTREAWLQALIDEVRPWFEEVDTPLPEQVRISVGFTSTGARSNRIGECWAPAADEHGLSQIFIHPKLVDTTEIAATVVHELVHAAINVGGHGPAFKKPATALGLEGRMTSTVPSEAFTARIKPVLEKLGHYPHGALHGAKSSAPKKQSTRMLKCECPECGYIARTTTKWIEAAGAPICPTDMIALEVS